MVKACVSVVFTLLMPGVRAGEGASRSGAQNPQTLRTRHLRRQRCRLGLKAGGLVESSHKSQGDPEMRPLVLPARGWSFCTPISDSGRGYLVGVRGFIESKEI